MKVRDVTTQSEGQPASGRPEARDGRYCPSSFRECFTFDASELNPAPKGLMETLIRLCVETRYSMTTLMRLSQYYHVKSLACAGMPGRVYRFLSAYLRRQNSVWNQFEHGANPRVAAGVIFHHPGVCVTSDTTLESGVHLYRNVTFGARNSGAPYVKRQAKVASHAVVIGPVVIGERAIVAPGAVVVRDVPDGKIAAGIPATIIGDVTDENYAF